MPQRHKKIRILLEYRVLAAWAATGISVFVLGTIIDDIIPMSSPSGIFVLGGVGILMLGMGWWWERQLLDPAKKLERALDRLADQKRWTHIRLPDSKEWQELADHLSQAVKRLQVNMENLSNSFFHDHARAEALEAELAQRQVEERHTKESYERRIQELSILRELSERIGYSLEMQNIVEVITGSLGKLLDYSSISYMLSEGDKIVFRCHLEQSVPSTYIYDIKRKMIQSMSALKGEEIGEAQVETILSGAVQDELIKAKVGSFFNGPLVIRGETVGILNIASTKERNYTESEMTLLYTITKQVSGAVAKLQDLLESEKGRLNAMVSSMVDGVVMTDPDLKLTVVNPALRTMLGIGDSPSVTTFDIVEALRPQIDIAGKLEESLKLERLVTGSEIIINNRFLQVIVAPVKNRANHLLGVVAIFHDTTQAKEIERLREDFTSMMVHELRSPLDGIRKISEALEKPEVQKDPATLKDFTGMIRRSSTEMLEMVGDLLDMAKIEAGKFDVSPAKGNLLEVISDREKYFSGLAQEAKLALTIEKPSSMLPDVSFDPARIKQVFNNLISNAIKYTEPGGRVALQIFVHTQGRDINEEARGVASLWQFAAGSPAVGQDYKNGVVIAVSDSGMGIAADHLPDLFNKFKQFAASAKSEKRGTGLGLAITKGIIEAHGGKIIIGSQEGKGTTALCILPL